MTDPNTANILDYLLIPYKTTLRDILRVLKPGWLTIHKDDEKKTIVFHIDEAVILASGFDTTVFQYFTKLSEADLYLHFIAHQLVTQGPKILLPTYEQCVLMSETQLNYPYQDYRQPFPTTIFMFPEAWRKEIAIPEWEPLVSLVNWDAKTGLVGLHHYYRTYHKMSDLSVYLLYPHRDDTPETTLEEALVRTLKYGGTVEVSSQLAPNPKVLQLTAQMAEQMSRVILNLSTLAVNYGQVGPTYPNTKYRQKLEKKNNPLAKKLLKEIPACYQIRQFLQFKLPPGYQRTGTNIPGVKKPHFRMGHWRNTPCGPQKTSRKQVYVNWTIVNKDKFEGSPEDTHYQKSF